MDDQQSNTGLGDDVVDYREGQRPPQVVVERPGGGAEAKKLTVAPFTSAANPGVLAERAKQAQAFARERLSQVRVELSKYGGRVFGEQALGSTAKQAIKDRIAPEGASPLRMRMSLELARKLSTSETTVLHEERLGQLQEVLREGGKIIVLTPHVDNNQQPRVASVLDSKLDIAMVHVSEHRDFKKHPEMLIPLAVMGGDNFLPVTYETTQGRENPVFNPADFEPMIQALDAGKAVVTSTPYRQYEEGVGKVITEKPALGAAYLALLTGATILPVGTWAEERRGIDPRPKAVVDIGEPIRIEKAEDIAVIQRVMAMRKGGESVSDVDRQAFLDASKKIRTQGLALTQAVANLLPAEMRGTWSQSQAQESPGTTTPA